MKVYDPLGYFNEETYDTDIYKWVPIASLLGGGYVSDNTNIKFSGAIIEAN